MPLNDLTPVTRKESILNGENIEPVTREEYFWQQAATSGSGGLPEYTAADVDKALMITSGETVVIPAQTITFTNGYGTAVGVDFSELSIGDEITFTGTALGNPVTLTGEVVADGDNLMIAFGDDYFKADGSAYISEIAEIPSVDVVADAVTISGDPAAEWSNPYVVVKATGTATKTGAVGVTITVGLDVESAKIAKCFAADTAKPVFFLVPIFDDTASPYYTYDNGGEMYMLGNKTEFYFEGSSNGSYLKYDGANNTLVKYIQGTT